MISSLFLESNSSFQTSVLYSQGFQHWFPFLVGTPWMRRRFFLFSVFRFSQAFIVPDLSRTGIRPTPKNPAGARILNSGEKEGYWRHQICLERIKQYRNQEPMRFWLHITKDLTKLRWRRRRRRRRRRQRQKRQ